MHRDVRAPPLLAAAAGVGLAKLQDINYASLPAKKVEQETLLSRPDALLGKMATVKFHLKYRVNFGQSLRVIGSHPKLGEAMRACLATDRKRPRMERGQLAWGLHRAPACSPRLSLLLTAVLMAHVHRAPLHALLPT